MSLVRIGTRGSRLALTQTGLVQGMLEGLGHRTERVVIRTTGDRTQAEGKPLPEIGGKGLFTLELDRALLDGEIDLAVHSLKDLPTEEEGELAIVAVPAREDPRDVIIAPRGRPGRLAELPRGATLATSSLRRRALALAFRPDLDVQPIRGNLDTRVRKVDEGQADALVVAGAGVRRLGLEERVGEWLERTAWLPSAGQGALAIVGRRGDDELREALDPLRDVETEGAVRAERSLLQGLGGGCQLPLGALAIPFDGKLRLWGVVASPDGRQVVRADVTGGIDDPEALGREAAEILKSRGAGRILRDLDIRAPTVSPP